MNPVATMNQALKCGSVKTANDTERSPLAKASTGLLVVMGHTIRRFESFPLRQLTPRALATAGAIPVPSRFVATPPTASILSL